MKSSVLSTMACRVRRAYGAFQPWVFSLLLLVTTSMLIISSPSLASAQERLAWNDPNPAQNVGGYYLYYWQEGQVVPTKINIGAANPYPLNTLPLVAGQTYTFAVAAYDPHGANESPLSNVVSEVVPLNHAPVAQNQALSITEDTAIRGRLRATDAEHHSLTYRLVRAGNRGTAVLRNASTGAFTYTPQGNATGTDTFTFRANDGTLNSNLATVTVTIAAVNDPPVANPDTATTAEDTAVTIQVLANDTDVDGDPLTLTAVTQGTQGQVAIVGTARVRYTPVANLTGQDTFTYTVSDGKGGSATGRVTVAIAAVNDAPVARNGSVQAPVGVATRGRLRASDRDGDALTYRLVRNGKKGIATLVNTANGAYTYTPAATTTGTDTFTFRVSDGLASSNLATVTVTILPPQNPFEVGEVAVNSSGTASPLQQPFLAPVVVAKAASYHDATPVVVRIRNVEAESFEIRLQTWEDRNDRHPIATVGYLVMEAGHHTLAGHVHVEAGTHLLTTPAPWTVLHFSQAFRTPPVVLTAVSSVDTSKAVTTRIRGITREQFRIRLQEQATNTTSHREETIDYIAWEPSQGMLANGLTFAVGTMTRTLDHTFRPIPFLAPFQAPPVFLADLQTTYGGATTTLRWTNHPLSSVAVKMEGEQSRDAATPQPDAVVGYLAFGNP